MPLPTTHNSRETTTAPSSADLLQATTEAVDARQMAFNAQAEAATLKLERSTEVYPTNHEYSHALIYDLTNLEQQIVIGRGDPMDGTSLSRSPNLRGEQCAITPGEDGLTIKELNDREGKEPEMIRATLYNGAKMTPDTPTLLQDGDILQFGQGDDGEGGFYIGIAYMYCEGEGERFLQLVPNKMYEEYYNGQVATSQIADTEKQANHRTALNKALRQQMERVALTTPQGREKVRKRALEKLWEEEKVSLERLINSEWRTDDGWNDTIRVDLSKSSTQLTRELLTNDPQSAHEVSGVNMTMRQTVNGPVVNWGGSAEGKIHRPTRAQKLNLEELPHDFDYRPLRSGDLITIGNSRAAGYIVEHQNDTLILHRVPSNLWEDAVRICSRANFDQNLSELLREELLRAAVTGSRERETRVAEQMVANDPEVHVLTMMMGVDSLSNLTRSDIVLSNLVMPATLGADELFEEREIGLKFGLSENQFTISQSATGEFQIQDGKGLSLSTGGTELNGKEILVEPVMLKEGDLISLLPRIQNGSRRMDYIYVKNSNGEPTLVRVPIHMNREHNNALQSIAKKIGDEKLSPVVRELYRAKLIDSAAILSNIARTESVVMRNTNQLLDQMSEVDLADQYSTQLNNAVTIDASRGDKMLNVRYLFYGPDTSLSTNIMNMGGDLKVKVTDEGKTLVTLIPNYPTSFSPVTASENGGFFVDDMLLENGISRTLFPGDILTTRPHPSQPNIAYIVLPSPNVQGQVHIVRLPEQLQKYIPQIRAIRREFQMIGRVSAMGKINKKLIDWAYKSGILTT